MQLNPARNEGESQADYRKRRAAENEAVKVYLYGEKRVVHHMNGIITNARHLPRSERPSRHNRLRMGHKAAKAQRQGMRRL